MANETYSEMYHRLQSLAGKISTEIPASMKGFAQLHQQSLQDGVLPRKIKELMALSISITTPCKGCIAYHVHDALKAGALRAEILETIGIAVMMAGGPGLVYGCEALEALSQFETENKK